jgi:HK97 family phage prohead protease
VNQNIIVRSFDAPGFETDEESGIIIGHPAVFNVPANIGGLFTEIIEPGAFDGCDMTDVLFFVNHDKQKIPLARSRRNNENSTMQINIDEKGLAIRANLDINNNQESKNLFSAVKRGDIDGMSFLFIISEQIWENQRSVMPTRRIKRFKKIIEVSAVNRPAYAATDIQARSLDNDRAALDSALQSQIEIERMRTKILFNGGI